MADWLPWFILAAYMGVLGFQTFMTVQNVKTNRLYRHAARIGDQNSAELRIEARMMLAELRIQQSVFRNMYESLALLSDERVAEMRTCPFNLRLSNLSEELGEQNGAGNADTPAGGLGATSGDSVAGPSQGEAGGDSPDKP